MRFLDEIFSLTTDGFVDAKFLGASNGLVTVDSPRMPRNGQKQILSYLAAGLNLFGMPCPLVAQGTSFTMQ